MERFEESILRYATREYERTSIGVLREKTVHAVLKDFYAGQEEDCKEIRIGFEREKSLKSKVHISVN